MKTNAEGIAGNFVAFLKVLPVLAFLCSPTCSHAKKHDIKFERITIEQGLSQNSCLGIAQDQQGFMWFGTWDGLNKYDGYDFTVYRHDSEDPGSLSNNAVMALHADRSGTIWAGTYGGGLNMYDPNTERFIRFRNDPGNRFSLSNDFVKKIYEDKSGTLWIATEGGLNKMMYEKGTPNAWFAAYKNITSDPRSISDNRVWSIFEDSRNVFWIGTENGLNRFDRETGNFSRYFADPANPRSLSHNHVRTIYEDRKNTLWIGTDGGGLNKYDRESGIFSSYRNDPADEHSLSNDNVWTVCEDLSGKMWIGTYGGGLNRFDSENGRFFRYQKKIYDPNSLGSNDIWSIFEDRSGMIWVGTFGGGIGKFGRDEPPFAHYRANPEDPRSLSHNEVVSIYEDKVGNVWIGTNGGGLNRLDREKGLFDVYRHNPDDPNSPAGDKIWAICGDGENTLWLGTWGEGLNKFETDNETFTHYRADPENQRSLANNMVRALYLDDSGILWIGTHGGGLNKFDPDKNIFTQYRFNPDNPAGLSNDKVWAINEDHTGLLWIGTFGGGLCKFDRETETFTRYTADPDNPQGLGNCRVHAIYEDGKNNLWIGTGIGLDKFDRENETFIHYRKKDGLPSDLIAGILEDNAGHIWISTHNKLSMFNPETGIFRNYNVRDNLQSDMFHIGSYHKNRNGMMYFGGVNGFNVFHPGKIKPNADAPPIVFTNLKIFGKPVKPGPDSVLSKPIGETKNLVLTHRDRIFSIEFAALSFAAPEKNRYRYKMEGLEDKWNEVDCTRHFVTFTGLPSGNYVLRVTGSNSDGVWNEEGAVLNISIPPFWWETGWFRVSFAGMALALAFVLYRRRVNSVERLNRQLEQQVETRTVELKESEKRFRCLSEATFEGVIIHENGRILEVNRALRDLFGYPNSEGAGLHVKQFITDESWETALKNMISGSKEPYEVEGVRKDGSTFPIEVRGKDATWLGRSVRVGSLRDITVQKRTEESLRRAKEEAEAAGRFKSSFIANMSHELRTPLNAILGFSELMARDSNLDIEQKDCLETIRESGKQLLALVNGILDLSKADAGLMKRQAVNFDILNMLDGLREMFLAKTREKKLALSFDVSHDFPRHVRGDRNKLGQVLTNLLENSVKFTSLGGIAVRALAKPKSETENIDTCDLHFEVRDTGVGIAPEELEKIFGTFSRAESGYASQNGTGLGLAISRRFVEMMGGVLTVKSETGRGTLFEFDISVETADSADLANIDFCRKIVGLAPGQLAYRILVVEDNETNRRLLTMLLEKTGFAVRGAVNGKEAVEIWRKWRPHLVWMDIRMPIKDGYEATRAIRKLEADACDLSTPDYRPRTPVIALTASAFEEDRQKVVEAGCDDFIHKPFKEAEIFEIMRKYLDARYVYENEKGTEKTENATLTPEIVKSLPEPIRTELKCAVEKIDFDAAMEIVGHIGKQDKNLAEALKNLVEEYRFDKLEELL